jgi:hypothetical protein
MRKLLILTTLALISFLSVAAQSDFREGFIINPANDTTFGFIQYEGIFQNPKVCLFKKELSSKIQVYYPMDLLAFRFTDSRYFQRMMVDINKETEPLFLEILIKGKVTILSCYDRGSLHFYVQTEENKLQELKKEETIVYIKGSKFLKESNKYMDVLKTVFAESATISDRVKEVELSQKSLVAIAHDYHYAVCNGEACIIYEKGLKPKNNRFLFGPLLGINAYRLLATEKPEENNTAWQYYDFGTTVYSSIGFFLRKNIPRLHDKFFVQYEGLYCSDELFGYNAAFKLLNYKDMEYIRHNRAFVQNALLFRREYENGNVDFSWHFGGFMDYTFKSVYEHTLQKMKLNGELNGDPILLDKVNPFFNTEFGLLVGTGAFISLNKNCELFADVRYQTSLGLKSGKPDYTNKHYLSLNLGIAFGK